MRFACSFRASPAFLFVLGASKGLFPFHVSISEGPLDVRAHQGDVKHFATWLCQAVAALLSIHEFFQLPFPCTYDFSKVSKVRAAESCAGFFENRPREKFVLFIYKRTTFSRPFLEVLLRKIQHKQRKMMALHWILDALSISQKSS